MTRLSRPEDIGALVRDRRRALGWSQAELGERIGARQAWVSDLEHGKNTLQLGKVLQALRALSIALNADHPGLMPSTEAPPRTKRPPIRIKDIVDG